MALRAVKVGAEGDIGSVRGTEGEAGMLLGAFALGAGLAGRTAETMRGGTAFQKEEGRTWESPVGTQKRG